MKRPFREHHVLQIFDAYLAQTSPLDYFLSQYFRANKSVGSKDRKAIAEAVYGIIRWRGLLDHLIDKPSWEARYRAYHEFIPEKHLESHAIPLHIRLSFPKNYFQYLLASLGQERATAFCLASNTPAPTTVRVNSLKMCRDELLNKWNPLFQVSACPKAQHGITFHKKENFFAMPEFKMGLFEVQDEASQLVANLVEVKPGERVLDYCAGAGGKALAIATKMNNKGQLFLHDIRAHALAEAKKRLARAGVQNAQILHSDAPHKSTLIETCDWVLVDAPCSGSGTLRRNPDMKWKFDETMVDRLVAEQRSIFAAALPFVKKGGKIAYATCSVLKIENENQAQYFETAFNLERQGDYFHSFPEKGGMDGFFGVVFKKTFW